MSTRTGNRIADQYLTRLELALGDLPRDRRQEIVEEIGDHVQSALDELGEAPDAQVRSLLERVGDPSELASDAREPLGIPPPRPTALEPIAILLLLFGGFLFVIGWLAGAILLWISPCWRTKDKVIGTLLFPGGLYSALLFFGPFLGDFFGADALGMTFQLLFGLSLTGPIFSAVWLGRRYAACRRAARANPS
jgi:hypothetical protein